MTGRPRRFKLIFKLLTATLALLLFLFFTSFEIQKDGKITFAEMLQNKLIFKKAVSKGCCKENDYLFHICHMSQW